LEQVDGITGEGGTGMPGAPGSGKSNGNGPDWRHISFLTAMARECSCFSSAFHLLLALRPFNRNYWMDARIVQPGLPGATAVFRQPSSPYPSVHPSTH